MTNPFDGLTALVVEDDGLVREDIAAWFRQQGWSVVETAIGAGALQLIREAGSLHLLFTDINLADAVTGWDVRKPAGRISGRALISPSRRRVSCWRLHGCPVAVAVVPRAVDQELAGEA
jgi:CheY-like chemotaxis protein